MYLKTINDLYLLLFRFFFEFLFNLDNLRALVKFTSLEYYLQLLSRNKEIILVKMKDF